MYQTYVPSATIYPREVMYHPQRGSYCGVEIGEERPFVYNTYSTDHSGYSNPQHFVKTTRRRLSPIRLRAPTAPASMVRVPVPADTAFLVSSPVMARRKSAYLPPEIRVAQRTKHYWEGQESFIEPEVFGIVRNDERPISPVEEIDEMEFEEFEEEEIENEDDGEENELDERDCKLDPGVKGSWTGQRSHTASPTRIRGPPAFSPPPGNKEPFMSVPNSTTEVLSCQPKAPPASLLRKYRLHSQDHEDKEKQLPPLLTVLKAHDSGSNTESSSHCTINPAVRSAVTRLLAEGPPQGLKPTGALRMPDTEEHEHGLRGWRPKDSERKGSSGGGSGDRVPSPTKPQMAPNTSPTQMPRPSWTRPSDVEVTGLMDPTLCWEMQLRRRGVPRSTSVPTTQHPSRAEVVAEQSKSAPVVREDSQSNEYVEGNQSYIQQLRRMRWQYLRHIREDMVRLEEIERFIDEYSRIVPAG